MLVLVASVGMTAAVGAGPVSGAPLRSIRVGRAPTLPPQASALGPLAGAARLQVTVALAPRDPAGLDAYATAVATPGSGVDRDYLTVPEFAQRFGPTSAQIGAVQSALRAQGLDPGVVSANGLAIGVSATAAQLEHAFSIGLERVAVRGGRTAIANTAAPSVAASAAGYVQGVVGLNTLAVPQPTAVMGARAAALSGARPARPARAARPGARAGARAAALPGVAASAVVTGGSQPCPTATTEAGKNATTYTADQLASAYRFSSLYGAGDLGAGQTVAVYELEGNFPSDINAYQSCYGTSASVSYQRVDGGASAARASHGDGQETELDVETVVGLAPSANVIVYQGPNATAGSGPYDTYAAIIGQDAAKVISTSWVTCEAQLGSSDALAEQTLFEEAAVQGQTVVAAAGDNGSEGCSTNALGVDDAGSQPFVTSVGGTSLTALGPPPSETVWNGICQTTACGGGGGVSALWSMPSYQSAAPAALSVINSASSRSPCGAPSGSYCREVPDVSADANPSTGYLIYWDGNGLPTDTAAWSRIGGTSAATPLWAALIALTNASSACSGTRIGFLNPDLYAVAATDYAGTFNDVIAGSNDIGANGGLFTAGPGYDMASGLGTPNGATLPAALCSAAIAAAATATATTPTTPTTTVPATTATTTTPKPKLSVADPGDQKGTVGTPVQLRISASATSGPAAYYAAGLPAGLSINASTGIISGTPSKPGSSVVAVAAADASGAFGGTGFRWTIAGRPTGSGRVLAGLASAHARLRIDVQSGPDGPALAAIQIGPPAGLRFHLGAGIAVTGPGGKRLKFAARLAHGVLSLSLASGATNAQVTIAFPALQVSAALAARARRHRVGALALVVAPTDVSGHTTVLRLRLRG
ncbi:MAG TPA: protease pro-enzyme activation domain-containing protein [Solirubrobacteraceae bacterium]|nr:protease pro-enzyme activation domain-containing protein [Solirubrobacteraceae bacterium]